MLLFGFIFAYTTFIKHWWWSGIWVVIFCDMSIISWTDSSQFVEKAIGLTYCLLFLILSSNLIHLKPFKVVRNKKSKFFLIVIWSSFRRQIEWAMSRICTMSFTYWNNASNIPFFPIFPEKLLCQRVWWCRFLAKNAQTTLCLKGCKICLQDDKEGKSRFDVSLKYW